MLVGWSSWVGAVGRRPARWPSSRSQSVDHSGSRNGRRCKPVPSTTPTGTTTTQADQFDGHYADQLDHHRGGGLDTDQADGLDGHQADGPTATTPRGISVAVEPRRHSRYEYDLSSHSTSNRA